MSGFRNWRAFAAGFAAATLMAWFGSGIRAQGPSPNVSACVGSDGIIRLAPAGGICPAGQQSLTLQKPSPNIDQPGDKPDRPEAGGGCSSKDIDALADRVTQLENSPAHKLVSNRVQAPFQVYSRSGKRIFVVGETRTVDLYDQAGTAAVQMSGYEDGGRLVARAPDGKYRVMMTAAGGHAGLEVWDSDLRIDLGRATDAGTYRLKVLKGGQLVAGIGETKTGAGAAVVGDPATHKGAELAVGDDGKGQIHIFTGNIDSVRLTEGDSGGGVLRIWGGGGTGPLVEAGATQEGYGVVRAGPRGFMPGVGIMGLPGSFLVGKN